ncbi:MAG: glycoside hydrolase family 27 protein, partial [Bacteroidia bacterium]|nr:glycoside hydrolase family 27 protein [Bacteroidia bacterium]
MSPKTKIPTLLSVIALMLVIASCTGNKNETLRLSSLDLSGTRQGWGSAMLDKSVTGKELSTWIPPVEQAIILTPKPGPKPRINGTKIFGVRPGSPFLFKIPATGNKPMKYEVLNLPFGLTVNPDTGVISGSIHVAGEYLTTFRVSNTLGTAERTFKIVCGNTLGLTPQMGWNSWYVWENHVTDNIMRASADAMVTTGMIDHGYMYINIDDCWSVKPGSKDPELNGEPRNSAGNININKRFPDMKAMTGYIHSKGLKAGTYTSPGTTTCAGHVSAYGYEEQDVKQYVSWGFDFLKYDWCS